MSIKRSGNLNSLQAKMENGGKKGLIAGANLVVKDAKNLVHVVSGDLQESLDRSNPQVVSRGVLEIKVGTNIDYAEEEEFRPGNRRIEPHTPHPYLRPALRANREMIKYLFAKDVVDSMKSGSGLR